MVDWGASKIDFAERLNFPTILANSATEFTFYAKIFLTSATTAAAVASAENHRLSRRM
jgi:hypothetical protein